MDGIRSAVVRWTGRWIVAGLVLALGVALILVTVAVVGKMTRAGIGGSGRYTIAFADIDCMPPPGKQRADFLAEVQYQSSLPSRLGLLEEGLAARLGAAFAHHPWVERVERVEIAPPGQVHVRLVYRAPVLRVRVPGLGGGYEVQVDAAGTRLGLPTQDLPLFDAGDGEKRDDRAVRAAARTVGFLQPYQDRLHITSVEGTAERLVLLGKWPGRVVWGRAPGAERPAEAGARQKLQRLLSYRARAPDTRLIGAVYDLRSPERPARTPP